MARLMLDSAYIVENSHHLPILELFIVKEQLRVLLDTNI